jgi:hypothetical protein
MLPYLDDAKPLLENVPAEFELPAASQNVLNGRVQNGFGSRGFTDFATTCQNYLLLCHVQVALDHEPGMLTTARRTCDAKKVIFIAADAHTCRFEAIQLIT